MMLVAVSISGCERRVAVNAVKVFGTSPVFHNQMKFMCCVFSMDTCLC